MVEDKKSEKVREEATGPRSEDERTQKMREQGTGPRKSLGKKQRRQHKLAPNRG
jgi:hypothetical protein